MRTIQNKKGFILYEKEKSDRVWEAVERLARLSAGALDDNAAAEVGVLFDEWTPGHTYCKGERISDQEGRLYRVVQDHTSQADWPIGDTPALYTPLGVTAEEPETIPEWKQPLGAEDAYAKGDRVRFEGVVYRSLMDANVYAPNVTGWEAEEV